MQQSNVIFGFILAAYIIYITLKGRLGVYLTLLRGGGTQPSGAVSQGIQSAVKGIGDFLYGGESESESEESGGARSSSNNPLDILGYSDSSYKALAEGLEAP